MAHLDKSITCLLSEYPIWKEYADGSCDICAVTSHSLIGRRKFQYLLCGSDRSRESNSSTSGYVGSLLPRLRCVVSRYSSRSSELTEHLTEAEVPTDVPTHKELIA